MKNPFEVYTVFLNIKLSYLLREVILDGFPLYVQHKEDIVLRDAQEWLAYGERLAVCISRIVHVAGSSPVDITYVFSILCLQDEAC